MQSELLVLHPCLHTFSLLKHQKTGIFYFLQDIDYTFSQKLDIFLIVINPYSKWIQGTFQGRIKNAFSMQQASAKCTRLFYSSAN